MSLRAYKLIKIQTKEVPTFNYSEHPRIFELATGENENFLTFEKEMLQNILKEKDNDYTKEEKKTIKNILKDFEKGDDFIDYYIC